MEIEPARKIDSGKRKGEIGKAKNTFSYAFVNALCASPDIQLLENAAVNGKLYFNKAFPGPDY